MKLSQVAHDAERIVRLTPIGSVQIEDGTSVRLSTSPNGVTVHSGTYVGMCEHPEALDADWLQAVTRSGAYLAELLGLTVPPVGDFGSRPQLLIRILAFDGVERWPEGRELGVDDTTIDDVNRFRKRADNAQAVADWLTSELTPEGGEPFAVISAGGGELNTEAFRLVGATIVADIRLETDRLIVSRLTHRSRRQGQRHVLALGAVSIVDATRMGRLSPAERQEVRRLAEADNAYLAIWEEYNDLEREAAKQAARDIGWADYDRFHVQADGSLEFELVAHQRSDTLRERMGSETVGLEAAEGVAFEGADSRKAVIGTARVTRRGTIVLQPDRPVDVSLPKRGRLAGAYTLDKIRIGRRESAQQTIARGETAPARQMSLLLADHRPDPVGRVHRHEPMSARVRQILGGQPTQAQVQAIDLAINSRDVVLIQGPPGTGKTRVIAAIQARLAELNKDAPALDKRVLLTSYQHDAVANLVQAADDGNLPPVKLGRAEGTDDEAYLVAWTNDLHSRLANRFKDVKPNATVRARRALVDRTTAYLHKRQDGSSGFDVASTISLLQWLAEQVDLVGSDIAFEARRLAKELGHHLGAATKARTQLQVARLARGLRSTAEGYADDGPATAAKALHTQAFFDLLDDGQRRALGAAARGAISPVAAAGQLHEIKQDVLDRLLDARARSSVVATMPVVEALLQRALLAADQEVSLATSPIDLAVERFRDAVEHQPAAIRHSIQSHTRALAATCQQAVSGSVRRAQTVAFDTVIIDEAARANPLDLMVPLSLARERVVLVGDHRQLPQLLDDTLVPQLSSRHDADIVTSVLSKSMFERLFVKLRESELRDGAKRAITLDRQFRTHPVLGTFISEQFYAPFGDRVENGNTDEAAFAHNLPAYAGTVCGWIDVPNHLGRETRTGTSLSRPAEATTIVSELASSLQSSTELTFGVIAFYSGQVAAIWEAMVESGLAVRRGRDHDLNPSVPWLHTHRGLPRVRIGSVDAFQGREFDVVYLSITRSRVQGARHANPFGFLVLPNRLCVAMSRQKKLLITVGDAATVTAPEGRRAVPALAAFHDLTGGEHGFRRSA